MLRRRITTTAAVIGALAIAAPVASAATNPASVQGAYQAGYAAAQGGLQAGAAATQSGWQAGADALKSTFGTSPFGFPWLMNLGPTGPLGSGGQHGGNVGG
jgi:hypothetical protein